MKHIIKRIYILLVRFWINPITIWMSIIGIFFFIKDVFVFHMQKYKSSERKYFSFGLPFPILDERFEEGDSTSGHYFHQDLLVAQRIFENNPNVITRCRCLQKQLVLGHDLAKTVKCYLINILRARREGILSKAMKRVYYFFK